MTPIDSIQDAFAHGETEKRLTPPDHIWSRIDTKLDKDHYSTKASIYKYISVAAIGICLITVAFLIQSHTSNTSSRHYVLEDLSSLHSYYADHMDYQSHLQILDLTYADMAEGVEVGF